MTTDRVSGSVHPTVVGSVRYRRNPEALFRYLTDGLVVLGPANNDPLFITGPAAALWLALAGPTSPNEAAASLAQQF